MSRREAGLVFDRDGYVIHWHTPADRSGGMLPDSRPLWEILWAARNRLGGVAHTHPWDGLAKPSATDVTTYSAIEAGLGRHLIWPIVTMTDVGYFVWGGPGAGKYDYVSVHADVLGCAHLSQEVIDKLRELSIVKEDDDA